MFYVRTIHSPGSPPLQRCQDIQSWGGGRASDQRDQPRYSPAALLHDCRAVGERQNNASQSRRLHRQADIGVFVGEQDIGALSDNAVSDFRAQRVGFIFQNFSLIPVLSAWENVEYPLMLLGVPAEERRERTTKMLEAVGLKDQWRQRPNELSGGQKQRVAIARALVKGPDFVLADEPTANLDSQTGASIVDLMRRMQEECETTFIFSTMTRT
jgi:ABC-type lipoprotein export system ATPase subunit